MGEKSGAGKFRGGMVAVPEQSLGEKWGFPSWSLGTRSEERKYVPTYKLGTRIISFFQGGVVLSCFERYLHRFEIWQTCDRLVARGLKCSTYLLIS
jgi:hypothetical protein